MRASIHIVLSVFTLVLLAGQAAAMPNIAVARSWDDVAIPNGGTFAFDSLGPGVADSRRFRIDNSGNTSLALSNATALVSGGCFSQLETPATPIAPAGSSYVRVRMQCSTPGSYSGSVAIASNDPDTPTYRFTLTGTILAPPAPDIALIRAWDNAGVANGGSFTFDPVPAGTSDSRRFRIDNTGDASLNLTNAAPLVDGACFEQLETPLTPIAAGGSSYFRVRFLCGTPGTSVGTVTIRSDDPDETPYRITLIATATAPPAPDIALVRNWDQGPIPNGGVFTFPDTPAGQPESRLFRVDNSGDGTLTIQNPSSVVSGNCFSQLDALPPAIGAGSSATFRVRFQCGAAGTYNGAISIQTNDPDESPYVVGLAGRIVASNGATFVSQSIPPAMIAGTAYDCSITLRNSGTTTWTAASNHRLGIRPDSAAATWGVSSRVDLAPGESIAPGATKTFAFRVQAPASAGTYTMQWQMVQELVEWFGDATPAVAVTVSAAGNSAAFVTQSVPAQVTAGRTFAVPVTMRNDGGTTWTAAAGYKLGSVAANNPFGSRATLPSSASVAPNAQHVFSFNVTAPSTPGVYAFQWRMLQENGAWFGATTPAVSITVRAGLPPSATSLAPDMVPAGAITDIAITGSNLQGAALTVAHPSDGRPAPLAQVLSVNGAGTQMVVRLDATNPAVDGFYALMIDNADGRDAIDVRVVPNRPVIDAYTPSEASWGDLYYVALFGANLDGVTVTSESSAVEVLDVQSDGEVLNGLLYVAPGSGSVSTTLQIRGAGGMASIPLELRERLAMKRQSFEVGEGKEGSGIVNIQDLVQLLPATPGKVGATCHFHHSRTRGRSGVNVILRNPITHRPDPRILEGLTHGEARFFESLIAVYSAGVTASVDIVCDELGVSMYFCVDIEVLYEIVGVGGQDVELSACTGPTNNVHFSGAGFLNFAFQWGDAGPGGGQCSTVEDVSPDPMYGLRQGKVTLNDCCTDPLSIDAEFTLAHDPDSRNEYQAHIGDINPSTSCGYPGCRTNVSVRAFIPANHLPSPNEECNGRPLIYRGDDRMFEQWPHLDRSRMWQTFCAETTGQPLGVGQTRKYASDAIDNNGVLGPEDDDGITGDCHLLHYVGFATPNGSLTRIPSPSGVNTWRTVAAGAIPDNLTAPDIDWDLTVSVDTNVNPPRIHVTGDHDGFPAYEIWINGVQVYGFDPVSSGPFSLFPPMDIHVDCTRTLGEAPCIQR